MAAPTGWFEVEATADQLAAAGKLVVQLHRHEILLLWNHGEPVALSNVCIHRGRKLNEGVMLGTRLVCAGHQWAYEVTTGYCKARERYQPRYALEVRDGQIFLELPPSEAPTPELTCVRIRGPSNIAQVQEALDAVGCKPDDRGHRLSLVAAVRQSAAGT